MTQHFRHFACILVVLFTGITPVLAQLEIQKTKHQFGELYEESVHVVDFAITNTSSKVEWILRADANKSCDIKYTTKKIAPDSTAIMRVQYNPEGKGAFNEKIMLWVGSKMEPIEFQVQGMVKYEPKSQYPACPDFSYDPLKVPAFEVTVKTIDSLTGEPVRAKVKLLRHGLPYKFLYTNERGIARKEVGIGPYYFVTTAEGYYTKEFPVYLNKANGFIVIPLVSPRETMTPIEPVVSTIEPNPISVDSLPTPPTLVDTLVVDDTPETPEGSTLLPVGQYAPNNIIFLVDVSTSMKQKGRLDLLKASMIEMVMQLRDIDRVAIVAYASNAGVVMDSRSAQNKEEIIEMIQNLEAGGSTEGGKGIRLAYKLAQDNFIEGGNNQVIIATDGAFDQEGGRIIKDVEKNAKKGISISVVGVVNERWTVKSMTAIAEKGQGNYIHIETYEQSRLLLLEEIKQNSRIAE